MLRVLAVAVLAVAGLAAGAAYGDEAAIRKAVQARFPDLPVESVTKTPFAGIYEVVLGGRILYTDEKSSFVFIGSLLDTRGAVERDLTAERNGQLAAQTLRKSTDQAIKRVRGNGKRVIYTFEDPNCGYCKQLQRELTKVNDVTVYTFLLPILSPDSVDKSKAIWCAKDRAKAWDDVMLRGAQIGGGGSEGGDAEHPSIQIEAPPTGRPWASTTVPRRRVFIAEDSTGAGCELSAGGLSSAALAPPFSAATGGVSPGPRHITANPYGVLALTPSSALESALEMAIDHGPFGPIPERRDFYRNDIETIKEVLSEPPLTHRILEILVRRRDNPDIDINGLRPADPLEGALLQHPEKLHLKNSRHFADFIEEYGPSIGEFKTSDSRSNGAGEGTLLMSE